MQSTLYVGTYTRGEGDQPPVAEGLIVYEMDTETGALRRVRAVDAGQDPTFFALTRDERYIFAANHLDEGYARVVRIEENDDLVPLNERPVHGSNPCYISLDPTERWLLVASYSSGDFTVLPLDEDNHILPASDVVRNAGSGPNKERQDGPHAHSIRFSQDGGFVFAVDLGTDRVWVYRLDTQAGKLLPHDPPAFELHPGAGPRHLDFSIDGQYVYIANELDSTITACRWESAAGKLEHLQTLSTLRGDFEGENYPADIHVSPSGGFVYVSNRGENTLAAFRIDRQSGRLELAGTYGCGGNWPRNFAIHPEGKFLLAANQYSHNIVVFKIAPDGSLQPAGIEVTEHSPVCLIFGG